MKSAVAALVLVVAAGCAQTRQAPLAAEGSAPPRRSAPAKCGACHLPPAERSLTAEKWPGYIKAHKRRLRLTDQEQSLLYEFLVGGQMPTAQVQ